MDQEMQSVQKEVKNMTRLDDISGGKNRTSIYTVVRDDCLYGDLSKNDTIQAVSGGANPILDVQNNVPGGYWDQTAIIENMVIDGNNQGVTGIRLRDVYNCWVRNVFIINCDVGILIEATSGNWCEANRLEHIRMEGVNKGIVLAAADNGTGQDFTTINDVGISLTNNSSSVGIQIGNPTSGKLVKSYSSFIKANVWLQTNGGTGMDVYGELRHSFVNFEVEKTSEGAAGTGVNISNPYYDRAVWFNQGSTFSGTYPNDTVDAKGFMLACGNLSNYVTYASGKSHSDINDQSN
jgi:hypothetical protein